MKKMEAPEKVIFICDGKKCGKYNKEIKKSFKEIIRENGMKNNVEIIKMDCIDNCKLAPNICLQPQNIWLAEVSENNVASIFKEYLQ